MMLFLFIFCLVVSSSFEDQLTSLNGSDPLDLGQANGPQETGRVYRLHRQSPFFVVVIVFVLDNCLILCLNQWPVLRTSISGLGGMLRSKPGLAGKRKSISFSIAVSTW